MNFQKLFFLLGLALLTGCVTTSRVPTSRYLDRIEPGSKLIRSTAISTVEQTPDGHFIYKEYFFDTRQLTVSKAFLDGDLTILDGPYRTWYDDGRPWAEGQHVRGKMVGEWKHYNLVRGSLSSVATYVDDQLDGLKISFDSLGNKWYETPYRAGKREGLKRIFNADGSLQAEVLYRDDQAQGVDPIEFDPDDLTPPQYPCDTVFARYNAKCGEHALIAYLARSINYPPNARDEGITGKALASFVVDKNGKIANVVVMHGLCRSISAEVERVVRRMPAWQPGRSAQGLPVKVRYTLPVSFRLE